MIYQPLKLKELYTNYLSTYNVALFFYTWISHVQVIVKAIHVNKVPLFFPQFLFLFLALSICHIATAWKERRHIGPMKRI